ncbi:hypothetical protein Pfo_009074 [Paulownia fortunei]|nr:hypothetical protein Pfo_009074 [Paulownia fortunei]
MANHVLGIATQVIVMAIVISVILLFLGIGVLVLIHVCIVGRTLRRGLSDRNVNVVERGSFGSTSMSQDDIEKLPCFDFKAKEKGSSPPADCAVCLENFRVGERCRLLPSCNHSFHAECVDLWLLRTPICPICRAGADLMKSGSLYAEESNSFSESGVEFRDGETTEAGQITETSPRNETEVQIAGIQAGESGNSNSTSGAEMGLDQTLENVDSSGTSFPESQTRETWNSTERVIDARESQEMGTRNLNNKEMAPLSSSCSKSHIVLFPFMSKGHTIPLLHLARLLLDRGVVITIFTTPANHSFISESLLGSADVSIVDLLFPENIPGIPQGIESTDKLPSMSLFISFVNGIKLMQPLFEEALQNIHSQVSCIVSDGFLHWTLQSASRFGIPRLCFYGMNYYAMALSRDALGNGLLSLHESDDEPFTVAGFPSIKLTRNDFDDPFDKRDPRGPHFDFIIEVATATTNSYGVLVNSFYELEQPYADYWNLKCQPKAWSIGPLCLAKQPEVGLSPCHKPKWMHWLDQKLAQGCPVLYVAFGSQAKISPTQLREIALGLEEANTSFLWVVRTRKVELNDGFEEKVRERGIIVNEWVDQREILEHPIVQGFLSHCGWNSVLEGICAAVPILAWPMMAEQYLNAKFVAEEIKVGLRVSTVDGSTKGFVSGKSLKNTVIELMEGEKGKELREKVKEVAEAASKAVADGGSSWHALNHLIKETHRQKGINNSKLN